ncbi:GNAT family N-acetyltransferase [Maribacter sp. CXY002]|uniref:GNAT family N-acetyltransferase n=1 Tax=Maribacter luteocoastalis TaxID=3407671 RepID=UPI003B67086F
MPEFEFDDFIIYPVQEKDAWRLCDFVIINSDRLKKYFPRTLALNLTPDLSKYFASKKAKEFLRKEEFLFVLKERKNRAIIGLIYLKKLDWNKGQAELAYAITKTFEGKGYTTKSVAKLSMWAFQQGFRTLQVVVNKENTSSIRVAEKCGFTWRTTLLKEYTPEQGPTLDMELYELSNER